MKVTFLGTAAVVPGAGHDTASALIDGRYLIDTGWCAALRMETFGFDPLALECLFLTHCHHDHYLGLPMLLFRRGLRAPNAPPLKIFGPAEDIERVVRRACAFLQADRYPEFDAAALAEIHPLAPGEGFEDERFRVETCGALHPVPALCYRFTERVNGVAAAFTGDTAPAAHLADHVRDVALLVTEASYGHHAAPADNRWLHQGAPEAARLAVEANVGQLALVHCNENRQAAALVAAREIFPNTIWPADGETISVSANPKKIG